MMHPAKLYREMISKITQLYDRKNNSTKCKSRQRVYAKVVFQRVNDILLTPVKFITSVHRNSDDTYVFLNVRSSCFVFI